MLVRRRKRVAVTALSPLGIGCSGVHAASQFGPGADAEFAVDAGQVGSDGLGADEKSRSLTALTISTVAGCTRRPEKDPQHVGADPVDPLVDQAGQVSARCEVAARRMLDTASQLDRIKRVLAGKIVDSRRHRAGQGDRGAP